MSLTILLVDDDYILAKGTAKLIERIGGHHVIIQDKPEEIIQLCQSGTIDIVIMDVNLSDAQLEDEYITGADLSCFLKSQESTAHIPIILLTAYALANERQSLLASSKADKLCTKPIMDYQAFLELILQIYQTYPSSH
ncbi:MAG TPA: response regulator [Cyanophyceae cyanobacterium]